MDKTPKGKFVCCRELSNVQHQEDETMCRFGAWHWLLKEAYYKDYPMQYKGRFITIRRGQIPTTYAKIAKAFNWSRSKVQRHLNELKQNGYIDTSAEHGFLIITICNFDNIQNLSRPSELPTDTTAGISAGIKTGTKRNNKTHLTNKKDRNFSRDDANVAPEGVVLSDLPYCFFRYLEERSDPAPFKQWLSDLKLGSDGIIYALNTTKRDRCNQHYLDLIQKACEKSKIKFKSIEARQCPRN